MWLPTLAIAQFCSAVRVEVGAATLAHPAKSKNEDAHVVSFIGKYLFAGVFDGVGGWASHGIDPSLYSRELSRLVHMALRTQLEDGEKIDLAKGLEKAAASNAQIGSCTACMVLVYPPSSEVTCLNLGDSAVWHIRPANDVPPKVLHRSAVQQYRFNMPYQLGTMSSDSVADADMSTYTISPGEYLIIGSDGLFDNLFDGDVLAMIGDPKWGTTADELAHHLVQRARRLSLDETRRSPFSVEAAKHGLRFEGGKVDDTTVVVIKAF